MDRNTQPINHILILLAFCKQDIKAQTHMDVVYKCVGSARYQYHNFLMFISEAHIPLKMQ